MYLLYLDESGTHGESDSVVVGGVAVFERSVFWLVKALNDVALAHFPAGMDSAPIHAHQFWRRDDQPTAEEPYRNMSAKARRTLGEAAYRVLRDTQHGVYFATVVEKRYAAEVLKRDAYEVAFEDLVSRFDLMLARMHSQGNTQRGLIIIAESQARERIEPLGHKILSRGTQWSLTKNIADIPLFSPVKNTRLLQVADMVSNAVYSRYQHGFARQMDLLLPKFDQENGRLHGLAHLVSNSSSCFCQACISKRSSGAALPPHGKRVPVASTDDGLSLSIPEGISLAQWRKAYIPVTLDGSPAAMPAVLQFEVDFPDEILEYVGASVSNAGLSDVELSVSDRFGRPDLLAVSLTAKGKGSAVIQPGTKVELTFKCVGGDSQGRMKQTLRLQQAEAWGADKKKVALAVRSGSVVCDWDRPTSSGHSEYDDSYPPF